MVFSKGALFVRNVNLNYNYTSVVSETTGLLYRISTTDWASSVVVIPSNKPLLTADHWIYGSLFNFPDGRLGVMGLTESGYLPFRLYTISDDGSSLTWDRDFSVADSWGPVLNMGPPATAIILSAFHIIKATRPTI